jgi:hypothetical protein
MTRKFLIQLKKTRLHDIEANDIKEVKKQLEMLKDIDEWVIDHVWERIEGKLVNVWKEWIKKR